MRSASGNDDGSLSAAEREGGGAAERCVHTMVRFFGVGFRLVLALVFALGYSWSSFSSSFSAVAFPFAIGNAVAIEPNEDRPACKKHCDARLGKGHLAALRA